MFLSSMRILENHAEQIFVLFGLYDHLTAVMLDNVLHAFNFKVGSINSIFYFLHKTAEPFNCLEQDNLA